MVWVSVPSCSCGKTVCPPHWNVGFDLKVNLIVSDESGRGHTTTDLLESTHREGIDLNSILAHMTNSSTPTGFALHCITVILFYYQCLTDN